MDSELIAAEKIIEKGCSKHPTYRAIRKVRADCQPCRDMWQARLEMNETAQPK